MWIFYLISIWLLEYQCSMPSNSKSRTTDLNKKKIMYVKRLYWYSYNFHLTILMKWNKKLRKGWEKIYFFSWVKSLGPFQIRIKNPLFFSKHNLAFHFIVSCFVSFHENYLCMRRRFSFIFMICIQVMYFSFFCYSLVSSKAKYISAKTKYLLWWSSQDYIISLYLHSARGTRSQP